MDKLNESVNKLSTQLDEVVLAINEMRDVITKQKNDELLERLKKLEISVKDQHIKLDALNAIDINPTVIAPTAPATVRVATKKRDDNVQETPEAEPEQKQFSNITAFFKHMWVAERETLYEKNVLSPEEYDKIYEENRDKFEKKRGNEIVLQTSIANQVWKSLPKDRKDIVYAMKNQNSTDVQKNNSIEIPEEADA